MEVMEEDFLAGCTVEGTEQEGTEVDMEVLVSHLYSCVHEDGQQKLSLVWFSHLLSPLMTLSLFAYGRRLRWWIRQRILSLQQRSLQPASYPLTPDPEFDRPGIRSHGIPRRSLHLSRSTLREHLYSDPFFLLRHGRSGRPARGAEDLPSTGLGGVFGTKVGEEDRRVDQGRSVRLFLFII